MEQKEWIIVTETSVGGVYEKKDGSVIVTSTYDGKGMIHTVHYKNATQTPTTEHIPEEIIREWIEKAKPLVDSAWNLALDEAIRQVKSAIIYPVEGIDGQFINKVNIINKISELKQPETQSH